MPAQVIAGPTRQKKLPWIVATLIILVIISLAIYATPYALFNRLQAALSKRDTTELAKLVDFPAIRENLKTQLTANVVQSTKSDSHLQSNQTAPLGFAVIPQILDLVVAPAGIEAMFAGQSLAEFIAQIIPPAPPRDAKGLSAIRVTEDQPPTEVKRCSYESMDRFVYVLGPIYRNPQVECYFSRTGLFDWKLTEMKLLAFPANRHIYISVT